MKSIRKLPAGALCLAALALVAAVPAARADDQERRIVKKVHVICEGGDCEHQGEEGGEHFSWFSGDGPGRFVFGYGSGGGFLGVGLTELTPELRSHFGVGEDEGVMISKVMESSPAERAGLAVGDIVTAVDGERVSSGHGLARSIRGKEDGESVLLEVWRDGSVQNLTAAVEERERGPHGMHHAFELDCKGDDCGSAHGPHHIMAHGLDFDCEDGPCRIQVQCEDDGDCVCTIDGEETDCGQLRGERD